MGTSSFENGIYGIIGQNGEAIAYGNFCGNLLSRIFGINMLKDIPEESIAPGNKRYISFW